VGKERVKKLVAEPETCGMQDQTSVESFSCARVAHREQVVPDILQPGCSNCFQLRYWRSVVGDGSEFKYKIFNGHKHGYTPVTNTYLDDI
jgi:hypothetical protein